ncbi:MAG: tRNA1(Val) (adenine(37)-N6)-methyltransferase [Pseudoramibacter sp.]
MTDTPNLSFKKPGERLEDLGLDGLTILQNPQAFRFNIDSVLLAWYASGAVHGRTKTADLGTGTGVLPLLLYGRTHTRCIDAVEIQKEMADMAARSVAMNRLEDQIHVYAGDLRKEPGTHLARGAYDVVVTNPPYMPKGQGAVNPDRPLAIARHEITCTLDDVAAAAQALLKDRGKLFMVHRADRLVDLCAVLRAHTLEIKRIRPVQPFPDKPANQVLLAAAKRGRPGAVIEAPLSIYAKPGVYSDEINRIYGTDGPASKTFR